MAQSKAFADASHALNDLSHALALLESENAKLRELVKDIDEVADPYLWEFIGRRMRELGVDA